MDDIRLRQRGHLEYHLHGFDTRQRMHMWSPNVAIHHLPPPTILQSSRPFSGLSVCQFQSRHFGPASAFLITLGAGRSKINVTNLARGNVARHSSLPHQALHEGAQRCLAQETENQLAGASKQVPGEGPQTCRQDLPPLDPFPPAIEIQDVGCPVDLMTYSTFYATW